MRAPFLRSSCFAVAVCNCAILLAPSAMAKEKQQPAPQWALDAAKTPTPANIGDASAVILFDEYFIAVDDQNHAIERERYAVRILKPQGRKYSHCEAEYDADEKLDYFHAWTIAADGRQLQAMDTDFKDVGAYGDADLQATERFRILSPPGADPGTVIACENQGSLRPYMNSENWEIQAPIPFVDEALELALPPGGHYADSWSRYAPVKPTETADNHLRWEIKGMPALDLENVHATPAVGGAGGAYVHHVGRRGRQGLGKPVASFRPLAGSARSASARSNAGDHRQGPGTYCRSA